jgi:hypothetical protein
MLTWKTVTDDGHRFQIAAHLYGYWYTITHSDDEPDEWGVEITDPRGGVVPEVCDSLEEAKRFCENTCGGGPSGGERQW